MTDTKWKGRFSKKLDEDTFRFSESFSIEQVLIPFDIEQNKAYAESLADAKVITAAEKNKLITALNNLMKKLVKGENPFKGKEEDIHMAIETYLTKECGECGKKIHTGRSRNDQVATVTRLYVKFEIEQIIGLNIRLQQTLLSLITKYGKTIIPAYTHLQKAQPVYLAQHLLVYIQQLIRDIDRLRDVYRRTNTLPLGSGACAGNTIGINQEKLAKRLGFNTVIANSMDAVSDRDYIIEFIAACSITAQHMSRLAEEIIFWNTKEFGWIDLPDEFSTGSSLMPQKKNPDILELIRGKTGKLYGNLVTILTIMKGLPLTYNRDMQEEKIPLFTSAKYIKETLFILSKVMKNATFNKKKIEASVENSFSNATDVAEYLVQQGIAFRDAHEITGKIVMYADKKDTYIHNLTIEELKKFSPKIKQDIFEYIKLKKCVERRNNISGTAWTSIQKQIDNVKKVISEYTGGGNKK
ncbi:argininosuccinate lyase [Candidatus Margulisiibacteriota bacterium]